MTLFNIYICNFSYKNELIFNFRLYMEHCPKCDGVLTSEDMVHRVKHSIFHADCFRFDAFLNNASKFYIILYQWASINRKFSRSIKSKVFLAYKYWASITGKVLIYASLKSKSYLLHKDFRISRD